MRSRGARVIRYAEIRRNPNSSAILQRSRPREALSPKTLRRS
jgi:hypothetical protein